MGTSALTLNLQEKVLTRDDDSTTNINPLGTQVEVEQEFEELNEQLFNAQQRVHELQQSLTESEAKRCALIPCGSVPPADISC